MEPQVQSFEVSTEPQKTPASEARGMIQSSPVSSVYQHSSIPTPGTVEQFEPQTFQAKFFTSKQITAAIAASERIRLVCSVVVALLVVLSHLWFPVLGSNMKDVISLRPFFLLLTTNVTVALAQLFYSGGASEKMIRGENKGPTDGHDLVEQVGNALEVAFMMQKVMDAVFMDFSVYALIIICGLSFE